MFVHAGMEGWVSYSIYPTISCLTCPSATPSSWKSNHHFFSKLYTSTSPFFHKHITTVFLYVTMYGHMCTHKKEKAAREKVGEKGRESSNVRSLQLTLLEIRTYSITTTTSSWRNKGLWGINKCYTHTNTHEIKF